MKLKLRVILPLIAILGITPIILQHFVPDLLPSPIKITTTPTMAKVSTFYKGIRLNVTVNDTSPRVGDSVLIDVRVTNVNSSDQIGYFFDSIDMTILNSEGKSVWACMIWYSRGYALSNTSIIPGYVNLTLHRTRGEAFVWKVETFPYFEEIKPGESYYIVANCCLQIKSEYSINIESDPIRIKIRS
ncbi:MAG: hypothetical protein ACFFCW_26630 [Candidatus Hodarchaeota archaeon]